MLYLALFVRSPQLHFCTVKLKYGFTEKIHLFRDVINSKLNQLGVPESCLPMVLSKFTLSCLTMLAGGGVDSAGLGGSDTANALSTEPAMSSTTQSHRTKSH